MARETPRTRIGVEILLVGMVLALLAGAVGLVALAQRRGAAPRPAPPVAVVQAEAPPELEPDLPPEPPKPPPPAPRPIDLTDERVSALRARIAETRRLAEEAERKADEVEKAAQLARDEAASWRTKAESLRDEHAAREIAAIRAESRADALARERDALAETRDAAREKLERARLKARDGVAVLPYKGPNGTWRRPIPIECRAGSASLRPGGPTFSMFEMTSSGGVRSNPLVLAVARAMVRSRGVPTPDGAAAVPYLVFLVRPDGIKPYYAARTLLEPLGIAYGYELVDDDADIDFPDLDDPREWPGAGPSPTWPPAGATASREGAPGAGGFDPPGRFAQGDGIGSGRGAGSGGLGVGPMPGGAVVPSSSSSRGAVAGQGADPGGWGGLAGRRNPGRGVPLDPQELEALGREGAGGGDPDAPRDGRIAWHPGMDDAPPAFEPPASPGSVGGGSPLGSDPRARGGDGGRVGLMQDPAGPLGEGGPDRGKPSEFGGGSRPGTILGMPPASRTGVPGGFANGGTGGAAGNADPIGRGAAGTPPVPGVRPGTTGFGLATDATGTGSPSAEAPPSGRDGSIGSQSLREAIARREGLVAPRMPRVPDRSIGMIEGGGAASGTGSASSTGAGATMAGGSTSASGSASGGMGMPGGASGGSGEGGSGWDTGVHLHSRNLPLTVACDRSGVTIHPGGTRLALADIARDANLLPSKLRAIVAENQKAEPETGFRPRVTFLVKPGGQSAYLKARWQATTGTNYPTTLQVVDPGAPRLSGDPLGGLWK